MWFADNGEMQMICDITDGSKKKVNKHDARCQVRKIHNNMIIRMHNLSHINTKVVWRLTTEHGCVSFRTEHQLQAVLR